MKNLEMNVCGLDCRIVRHEDADGNVWYSSYVEGIEVIPGTFCYDELNCVIPCDCGLTYTGFVRDANKVPMIGWDTCWEALENFSIKDVIYWTRKLAQEVANFLSNPEKMAQKNKIINYNLFRMASGNICSFNIDKCDLSFKQFQKN